MLLVSFGSPSAIGYAVMNIARQVLQGCVGAHAVYHVVRLEDFKEMWQASSEDERQAVLITSDCPHLDVVSLCLASRGPIIVSCDTFEHVVGYLMRAREMEFAPAVRLATQVVCALEVLARAPNVLRISSDDYGREVRTLAASLAGFIGLDAADAAFDAAMREALAGAEAPDETLRAHVERHFPHFSDDIEALALLPGERAALATLARRYDALIEGRAVDAIDWPTELFIGADRPGRPLDGPIDLVGPARCIVYGPYLHLPVGRWRVSVDVEVNDCLSDNRLGVEAVAGQVVAAVTMRLPARGQRGFDLDVEVTDPFLAIELRFQLLTGAIEGDFRLLHVRVSPNGGADVGGRAAVPRRADGEGRGTGRAG